MITTFIESLFVFQGIDNTPGSRLKICTTAQSDTTRGARASLSVVSEDDATINPVVEVEELILSSVGTPIEKVQSEIGDLCSKFFLNNDISFMTPGDFSGLSKTTMDASELKIAADLQRACFHILERALSELTEDDKAGLVGHRLAMFEWMIAQHELARQGRLDHQNPSWLDSSKEEQDKLFAVVDPATVNGELCVRVGNHLVQILCKEIEPLEIMMEGQLLYKYYENALGLKQIYGHISNVLHLFSHKNLGARIIEIGGGTGGCIVPALRALTGGDDGIPRFAHYDFTDISSGFFEKAREKLAKWGDRISFKKFDVENDPESQGVECGEYDLVIACNVLHATAYNSRGWAPSASSTLARTT